MRKIYITIAAFAFLFVIGTAHISNARSCSTGRCAGVSNTENKSSEDDIKKHIDDEFTANETWWISIFWEDNILPALMLMSEQLTAVGMKQVEIIGTFMDAKHQLETQQVFSELTARAHKDYHPSVGMCEFGSSVKSLAASESLGTMNATIMAQRSMDRMLGNANTAGAGGTISDIPSRLNQFRKVYCNLNDNNNGLATMCDHDQDTTTSGAGAADPMRMNKDIDVARTLDAPWTLDVNLTNGGNATPDEEDVFALGANLFGSEVFYRPGSGLLRDKENLQKAYLDARAYMAKRSVAENSFNAIVAQKSAGTAGSRDFLEALLKEIGITDTGNATVKTPNGNKTELDALLGDNPSYYAQMEVLTKKIYQNPDFYTNLYDKPANVERKGVAIQAIALMQKFDLYKSYLRNEATMSILLELAVNEIQGDLESKFGVNTSNQIEKEN